MPRTAPAGDPFDALGDPNRRAIVELLAAASRSVREIADELPISRPAVSRHLRLLKEAGLVVEEARGTRRIYRLHDEGVEAVRAYLAQVWGDAAIRFRLVADNARPRRRRAMIEPIRLSFEVACPAPRAFEIWTARTSHLVAGQPYGERRAGPRGRLRAASWRPDLRADRRGAGVRLGRDRRLGAAPPARLPVAPAGRPGRRDRGRDHVRRRRPRTDDRRNRASRLGSPRVTRPVAAGPNGAGWAGLLLQFVAATGAATTSAEG